MGNGNLKSSYVFLRIVFYSILLSVLLLPIVDYLLIRFGYEFDLHRVYSRIFLLSFLFLFFKSDIRKRNFLFFPSASKESVIAFLKYFLFGIFFINIVVFFQVFFDVRFFKGFLSVSKSFPKLFSSIVTGIVVGIFETYIFWFFLFNLFEKDYGQKKAAMVIILLFFISHFLKTQQVSREGGLYFFKGIEIFIKSFYGLLNFKDNLFYMIGILLLGIFFTDLYISMNRNFWVVSGIHSGAVFMIKADRIFFDFGEKRWEWLTGASNCIDGVLGWIFILLLIIYIRIKYKRVE